MNDSGWLVILILSSLLEGEEIELHKTLKGQFQLGVRLIVMPNSDTTAATLTYIFYHLAMDPTQIEKLRAELHLMLSSGSALSVKDLQGAEYLNGVINEALRL